MVARSLATACLWAMAQLQSQNGHLDDSLTCGHWVNMACPPKNGAFANARGCGVFAGVSPWPWRACRSPGRCPQPGPGPTGALGAPWFCSKRAGDGLALNLKTASQALNLAWTVTSNRCPQGLPLGPAFQASKVLSETVLVASLDSPPGSLSELCASSAWVGIIQKCIRTSR